METVIAVSSLVANLAAALGIPLAVAVFAADRRRAQREREEGTYLALHDMYVETLRFCCDNVQLGLHDYKPVSGPPVSAETEGRKMIGFEMVTSMLEAAHFLYHQQHRTAFRSRQWSGWDEYARGWAQRQDYQHAWRACLNSQYDSQFVRYMNSIMPPVSELSSDGSVVTGH